MYKYKQLLRDPFQTLFSLLSSTIRFSLSLSFCSSHISVLIPVSSGSACNSILIRGIISATCELPWLRFFFPLDITFEDFHLFFNCWRTSSSSLVILIDTNDICLILNLNNSSVLVHCCNLCCNEFLYFVWVSVKCACCFCACLCLLGYEHYFLCLYNCVQAQFYKHISHFFDKPQHLP